MALIDLFMRLFVTKSILIQAFVGLFFASLTHLVLVLYYIITYILPNKKIMDKALKFIKDHREDSS
jgi:hypothetical protein